MIDIETTFDEQLIAEIKNYFRREIIPKIHTYSETIPTEEKRILFNNLFTDDAILSLIDASPDALEEFADNVYRTFPEFAERYHPQIIYQDITEDLSIFDNIKVVTGHELVITESARLVIARINEINFHRNSTLFLSVKEELADNVSKTKKLKALQKIRNYITGHYKINQIYINNLPVWTRTPFDMFDYIQFRKTFGRRLINSHNLKVCPFCAHDSVDIVNGVRKNHLPALDHFLPKSKYPFFALSVNNLLPTCHRCNSSFKGEIDMIKNNYHPLRDRINNVDVFHFNLALDTPFENPRPEALSINIECNIRKFMNNASIFELDALYNLDKCKKIFFDARERCEYYKNHGEYSPIEILADNYLTRMKLHIDRGADPKRESLQKFQIEVLKAMNDSLQQ
ncbi:hypothetical protein [Aeromonas veronii]|uniref:hypothetical protein n=1 Tax=Aeromonas veronii TaxID=654 RepID=UPI003D1D5357